MASLLEALLQNESGGRNIPNVHEGTSSGQAQGYFQITTGTWDEFGGRKYAPTPMEATKEQQADIASRIPLKRWDESTIAKMRATGKPIDLDRTLGENLAMHGENAANFTPGTTITSTPLRHVGGAGSGGDYFAQPTLSIDGGTNAPPAAPKTWLEGFKERLGSDTGGATDLLKGLSGDTGEKTDPLANAEGNLSLMDDSGRFQAAQALMSAILAGRKNQGTTLTSVPTGGTQWPRIY